jgi:hypothetical protein
MVATLLKRQPRGELVESSLVFSHGSCLAAKSNGSNASSLGRATSSLATSAAGSLCVLAASLSILHGEAGYSGCVCSSLRTYSKIDFLTVTLCRRGSQGCQAFHHSTQVANKSWTFAATGISAVMSSDVSVVISRGCQFLAGDCSNHFFLVADALCRRYQVFLAHIEAVAFIVQCLPAG